MTAEQSSKRVIWLYPLIISCAVAAAVITVVLTTGGSLAGLPDRLSSLGAGGSLGNLPEVVAAVLGIAITVVAIIVELAANRYTPRITDLFFREPANYLIMSFFVLVCIDCIWAAAVEGAGVHSPVIGITTMVLTTISFVLLLPYFAYVFVFLDPSQVVKRISRAVLESIRGLGSGDRKPVVRHKREAIEGVEQIADVALNAIGKKDKGISIACVSALGHLTREYLDVKEALAPEWFEVDDVVLHNADFVSLQRDVGQDIEARKVWFEMKVFRQYQMTYNEALNKLRDLDYIIAIETRLVGEKALRMNEGEVLRLCVKFFNTFMRATINARDVRTAYNLLNQYRILLEAALRAKETKMACEIAVRFRDYGLLGFSSDLPFILETAAYDLCTANQLAYDLDSEARDQLLELFLTVDKEEDLPHKHEAALRGVRKAQVKLATYYLVHQEQALARRIYDDMRDEIPERLASIRDELMSIEEKEYWEVTDRGTNFDYLEPERKRSLDEFFGWFGDVLPPPTSVGSGKGIRPTSV